MAKKRKMSKIFTRTWGGVKFYASTKAGDWPDYVGPNGRRSSKMLAHRLFRRTEKMRLKNSAD